MRGSLHNNRHLFFCQTPQQLYVEVVSVLPSNSPSHAMSDPPHTVRWSRVGRCAQPLGSSKLPGGRACKPVMNILQAQTVIAHMLHLLVALKKQPSIFKNISCHTYSWVLGRNSLFILHLMETCLNILLSYTYSSSPTYLHFSNEMVPLLSSQSQGVLCCRLVSPLKSQAFPGPLVSGGELLGVEVLAGRRMA